MFTTTFFGHLMRIIPYKSENWVLVKDLADFANFIEGKAESLAVHTFKRGEIAHLFHLTTSTSDAPKTFVSPSGAKSYLFEAEYCEEFIDWLESLSLADDPFSGVVSKKGFERGRSFSWKKELSFVSRWTQEDVDRLHAERSKGTWYDPNRTPAGIPVSQNA